MGQFSSLGRFRCITCPIE